MLLSDNKATPIGLIEKLKGTLESSKVLLYHTTLIILLCE